MTKRRSVIIGFIVVLLALSTLILSSEVFTKSVQAELVNTTQSEEQSDFALDNTGSTTNNNVISNDPSDGSLLQNEITCRFDVGDAGDSDPATFVFIAQSPESFTQLDWTLGDGTFASGESVFHTYAASGQYTVSLACVPIEGVARIASNTVSVELPVAEPEESSTPEATPELTNTPEETVTPIETTEVTGEPEDVTPEATAEVTSDPAPTDTSEETPTPDATTSEASTPISRVELGDDGPVALGGANPQGASCQMNLNDAGDDNPFTFDVSATATGIEGFNWDFDVAAGVSIDATGANPATHTYPATGSYTIQLDCIDNEGDPIQLQGFVSISSSPVLNFSLSASTTTFAYPFTLYVTNLTSGPIDPATYVWEVFQVGNPTPVFTSTLLNPFFDFTATEGEGDYFVRLSVDDFLGNTLTLDSSFFTVLDPAPFLDFEVSPSNGTTADTFTITLLNDPGLPILEDSEIQWDFTDGSPTISGGNLTPTGRGPFTVQYAAEGTYSVDLAYGNTGGVGAVTRQIGVYDPAATVTAIFTEISRQNLSPTTFEVCFENQSTGPITYYEWDFDGDSTPDSNSSAQIVCFVYNTLAAGIYNASLYVEGANPSIFSNATEIVFATGAPEAVIDVLPGFTVNWGDTITLSDDNSIGDIQMWEWDLDGDGTFEVSNNTGANPTVTYNQAGDLGTHIYSLRVTDINGLTSTATVAVLVLNVDITCDNITGNNNPAPSDTRNYNVTVGSVLGRTLVRNWSITGPAGGFNIVNADNPYRIQWLLPGTYLMTVEVEATETGSTCTRTEQIEVEYPPLSCTIDLSGDTTSPWILIPDGSGYNFDVTVGSRAGRQLNFEWFIDGVSQGVVGPFSSNTNTFTFTPPIDVEGSRTISVIASATDGSSSCGDGPETLTIEWPELTCSWGSFTNTPRTVAGSPNTYTYSVNWNNDNGLVPVVTWLINRDGAGFVPIANPPLSSGPTMGASSSSVVLSFPIADEDIGYDLRVIIDNTAGGPPRDSAPCQLDRSFNVNTPEIRCDAINGDIFPVINETPVYTASLSRVYGRTLTYTWTLRDSGGVVIDTSNAMDYDVNLEMGNIFTVPGDTFTLELEVFGTPPNSTCSPTASVTITVEEDVFACNAWVSGTFSPTVIATPGNNYQFVVDIDNTNGFLLDYDLVIENPLTGGPQIIAQQSVNTDGNVTFNVLGSDLDIAGIGDYTINIFVDDDNDSDTAYACDFGARTIRLANLNVTYTVAPGTDANAGVGGFQVLAGTPVCLTNTSTTSFDAGGDTPPSDELINYTYIVNPSAGVTSFPGANPDEICFDLPTTDGVAYTIELTGQTPETTRTDSSGLTTFTVYAFESLAATRNPQASVVFESMTFDAIDVNIGSNNNLYDWEFYLDTGSGYNLIRTRNNTKSTTESFGTAGRYRAVVTATGDLGVYQAEVVFDLLGLSDLRAAFFESPRQGESPLTVCFTDESQPRADIIRWEWDFGDGSPNVIYNAYQPQICHTFVGNPGDTFSIVLTVDSATLQRTAGDVVRINTALQSNASFSITPNGGGNFCFTPVLNGVNVDHWDFGDGTGDGPPASTGNGQICHTYGASGTYIVVMWVTDGGTPEPVERPVVVNIFDPPVVPVFSATSSCSAGPMGVFNLTNTGDSMVTPDTVTIRDAANVIVLQQSVLLANGETIALNFNPTVGGNVTLTLLDSTFTDTLMGCPDPPDITVTPTCNGDYVRFTISNALGPMAGPQNYTVEDESSTVVTSGSFNIAQGGPDVIVDIPNPYGEYTFISNGVVGNFSVPHRCNFPPIVAVTTNSCATSVITFTVENTGADMLLAQDFTITDSGGNPVAYLPNDVTFQLAASASITYTIDAALSPYEAYTFTADGVAGFISALSSTHDCADPTLRIESTCSDPLTFTVHNDGPGDMLTTETLDVVDGGGNPVSFTGGNSIMLASGGSHTITLDATLDPYAPYTLNITGGFAGGEKTDVVDCADPTLRIESTCGDPLTFTIFNDGPGDMLEAETVSVVDGSSNPVTIDVTSINLANGASQVITLDATLDPYAPYTLSITGGFAGGEKTDSIDCADPTLRIESTCGDPLTFTIYNDGPGDMLEAETVSVTDGVGNPVSIDVTSINLANGASQVITLDATIDPYALYTLNITGGFAGGEKTDSIDCADPTLRIESTCGEPLTFTIHNDGPGDMLEPETVSVVDGGSNPVTIDVTMIMLASGGSQVITLDAAVDPYDVYTLSITGGFAPGEKTDSMDCVNVTLRIESTCGDPLTFTIYNDGPGDMLEAETVSVVDGLANPVSIDVSSVQLNNGGSQVITLDDTIDPYAAYTITVAGFSGGEKTDSIDCADPTLRIESTCGDPLTFTIYNDGPGDMLEAETVSVVDGSSNPVTIDVTSINLANGASQVITLDATVDPYAPYTLNITGGFASGEKTDSIDCADPTLRIESTCADPLTFTIFNDGPGDMLEAETVSVVDGSANPVTIDVTSIQLNNGGSQVITLDATIDPYVPYTLMVIGFASGEKTDSIDCADPTLRIESTCADPLTFTIYNDGPGDMLEAETVSVVDGSSNPVTIDVTSIQLNNGGSQVITLDATIDPYAPYTLTVAGFASGEKTDGIDCADPTLRIESTCGDPLTFTIYNDGPGDMLEAETVSVVDGSSNPVTIDVTSIQLNNGGSQVITLDDTIDPYAPYTLNVAGYARGEKTDGIDCADPTLRIESTCGDPLTFTIYNDGPGDMLEAETVSVVDGSSNPVTIDVTSIQLNNGGSQVITLDDTIDPYAPYTLNVAGYARGEKTDGIDCEDPTLDITSLCAVPLTFTITNNGPGDMLEAETVSVVDADGSPITIDVTSIQLNNGEVQVVTLDSTINPYAPYTLTVDGYARGEKTDIVDCEDPEIVVSHSCSETLTLFINNVGGEMLIEQAFTLTDAGGQPVIYTPTDTTFDLATDESLILTLPGANPYFAYIFGTDGFAAVINYIMDCPEPDLQVVGVCDSPIVFNVTNIGSNMLTPHYVTVTDNDGDVVSYTPASFLLEQGQSAQIVLDETYGIYNYSSAGLDATVEMTVNCPLPVGGPFTGLGEIPENVPDFTNVETCGFSCPVFHVYHTDETGNWEIFRLDGADDVQRETFRQNLSQGVGEEVDDVAPSRSPNAEWIVFSSNRDGNWEIYVAPTNGDGSQIQRVTYNTFAIDTDPVWGPHNFVVFESTRDGNWELYLMDMETGDEYRLTDNDANDINPFWSPDGSKLIFQSDREGFWQIYEMDLISRTIRQLSDDTGADVDPQYNNAGDRIVFRSYRDGGDSVLYTMDVNGNNVRRLTGLDEDATNAAWSPNDRLIAFQSDLDGDLDVYVIEFATGERRQLTDNTIDDYAPTWTCSSTELLFTSDIEGNPDIYMADAVPISDPAILVEEDADQMTFEDFNDIYPENTPSEENASREGQTILGVFGEQTTFLLPDASATDIDVSFSGADVREDWVPNESCDR